MVSAPSLRPQRFDWVLLAAELRPIFAAKDLSKEASELEDEG